MDSSTYYEYQRRIEAAVANKDINELKNIRAELETYRDPDAQKLILSLRL